MAPQTAATQKKLKITTQVLPGHKLEIQLPSDTIVGQDIEVFVSLPEPNEASNLNVLNLITTARQRHAKRTAVDIDQQIRAERDTWDS